MSKDCNTIGWCIPCGEPNWPLWHDPYVPLEALFDLKEDQDESQLDDDK